MKMFIFFPKLLTQKSLPFVKMAILIETSSLLSFAKIYTGSQLLVVSINPIQMTAVHHSSARGLPNYLMLLPNYCLMPEKNSFLSQQDIQCLSSPPFTSFITVQISLCLFLSICGLLRVAQRFCLTIEHHQYYPNCFRFLFQNWRKYHNKSIFFFLVIFLYHFSPFFLFTSQAEVDSNDLHLLCYMKA